MADTESKFEPYFAEQTTKNGDKYAVTYKNPDEAAEAAQILAKEDDGAGMVNPPNYVAINVDCPVGSSGSLAGTDAANLGFTHYAVVNDTWSIWDYRLDFNMIGPACKLWFTDERGVEYFKLHLDDGDFSLAYSSPWQQILRF